jgi:hypothetical protein
MNKIRKFLLEMGGGDFSFIGNQYKLHIGGEDSFIDLLLYHRKLKSLVVIELKAGKFKPEFAVKINFYLSVLNETIKQEDENPSIGIIICKNKNKTIVEYALKNTTNPIGISSYILTETLPKKYRKLLPSPKEIDERLSDFIDEIPEERNKN